MNVLQMFAHGEDYHNAATGDLEHIFTSAPVALPLFIILNIVVFQILKRTRKAATLPFLLGMNLVIGVTTFELVPAVSIAAITVGIVSALMVTLTLLAK